MTKPKPLPRDVPKLFQLFRKFLLGRQHNSPLRFAEDISKRTQSQPNLPLGPASKIRDNYYCDRDARSEVHRPKEVYGPEVEKQKLLKAYDPWERCEVKNKKNQAVLSVPGKVHHWDKVID